MQYQHIDLFSGIGGFSLGLKQSGFPISKIYFSEVDKYAITVYKKQFPKAEYLGGVESVSTRGFKGRKTIITFGFPCQDLSTAGKRKGFDGSRSSLFFEAMRIIKQVRPRYFIWENVKGLLSSNKGKDLEMTVDTMVKTGYIFDFDIQNTSWFLPQNRERIYCVGMDIRWIGKQLLEDVKSGNNGNLTLYKRILKGYLSSKLQQNFKGLKKPQEQGSIDSVLNYIVGKKLCVSSGKKVRSRFLEIISILDLESYIKNYLDTLYLQSKPKGTQLDLSGKENHLDWHKGIKLDGKQKKGKKKLFKYIEKSLKNISEENFSQLKLYTISTWLKITTKLTTYSYVTNNALIDLYIIVLTNWQKDLLKKVSSDLTEELKDMNYVKNRTKKIRNNEKNSHVQLSLFDTERVSDDFVGSLAGTSRPKVFPIRNSDGKTKKSDEGTRSRIIDPNYLEHDCRIYDEISPCLKKSNYKDPPIVQPVMAPNRSNKHQKGRRFKEDGGIRQMPIIANCVTPDAYLARGTRNRDKNGKAILTSMYDRRIRRLTPTECEKLQGFPPEWTKYGHEGQEISDTQRYKMCGNAVSVPVVKEIGKRLIKQIEQSK